MKYKGHAALLPVMGMLGFVAFNGVQRLTFVLNSQTALALVTRVDAQDTTCRSSDGGYPCRRYEATIEYAYLGSKPVNTAFDAGSSGISCDGTAEPAAFEPGQRVRILYDKENPFRVMVDNAPTFWVSTISPMLIGLVVLLVGRARPRFW